MADARVISRVELVCEDSVPLHLIASYGERFILRWDERHAEGHWVTHRRYLGVEARAMVGKAWHHPLLLQAMGFDPKDYSVAAGSPLDDATAPAPAPAPPSS